MDGCRHPTPSYNRDVYAGGGPSYNSDVYKGRGPSYLVITGTSMREGDLFITGASTRDGGPGNELIPPQIQLEVIFLIFYIF